MKKKFEGDTDGPLGARGEALDRQMVRELALSKMLKTYYSNLYAFLEKRGQYKPVKLAIIYRNNKDLICVATAWDTIDGTRYVCFGQGDDLQAALAGLNAAIGAGKWRPDLYAQ